MSLLRSLKDKLKDFVGRLSIIEPVYSLLRLIFYNANRELYKRALTRLPSLRFTANQDILRTPMYSAIFQFLSQLSEKEELKGKKAIEIGGSEGTIRDLFKEFGVDYKIASDFPEVDIHRLPYPDNTFDFLVLDQVLEHVPKPWVGAGEVFRVLKPGGICIATGPFMVGYHGTDIYSDYWRFTPSGWRSLFSQFEVLEADGWGNDLVVQAIIKASPAPSPWHAISPREAINKKWLEHTDGRNQVVTWCIARKPGQTKLAGEKG